MIHVNCVCLHGGFQRKFYMSFFFWEGGGVGVGVVCSQYFLCTIYVHVVVTFT